MDKQAFERIVQQYNAWITEIENVSYSIHQQTNQEYDKNLPYGFHLKLAASFVTQYGYCVAENEVDVLVLYASAYFHDAIEDARLSYNDVARLFKDFRVEGCVLDEESTSCIAHRVPEIVYALTNEKGRNRHERANDSYYKGIRDTRFAPFIKMCDRMANIRYGTLFGWKSRMFEVYRKEYPEFIESIDNGAVTPVPEVMKQELLQMLSE